LATKKLVKKLKKKAKPKKFAAGGSTSARADGIASKGKTKCAMPKMAKGGKMKGC
jgi:hypothetical protein